MQSDVQLQVMVSLLSCNGLPPSLSKKKKSEVKFNSILGKYVL